MMGVASEKPLVLPCIHACAPQRGGREERTARLAAGLRWVALAPEGIGAELTVAFVGDVLNVDTAHHVVASIACRKVQVLA
jgi:hypothetical protein